MITQNECGVMTSNVSEILLLLSYVTRTHTHNIFAFMRKCYKEQMILTLQILQRKWSLEAVISLQQKLLSQWCFKI